MISSERRRARIAFAGMAVVAGVISYTLYSTQITKGAMYAAKANAQYNRPLSGFFDRGKIYFLAKDDTRVTAAVVDTGKTVYVNPKQLEDPAQTFEALSQFISLDKQAFIKSASNKNLSYVELSHRTDNTLAQSVLALDIQGLGVVPERWRSYPGGALAAQTLGLVGEDSSTSTIAGKYGLEKSYEDILKRSSVTSGAGVFARIFEGVKDTFGGQSEEGDIVTNIEPTVETYLEKVLAETDNIWHADEIGGIIMDPKTGAVVALSSLPTFNGNDTSLVKNAAVFSNPLVEHVYELGSIMKPLTMAVGLDTGEFTPKSTYEDTGTMTLNGKTIANFDGRARGKTDMQQILSQSLNIGAATIALKVGGQKLSDYFESFGLADKTGVDLPNEAKGLIGNIRNGRDINVATASYGQGIAVSPMQMARALSILANGGYLVKPRIVSEIDYSDGRKKVIEPEKIGPVISPETAHTVTAMLIEVVDLALKKGAIKEEHYSIAAKTGTAQIPDHQNGGYYKDRYLHSFFGYFPAYDPRFIIFLYQINPKGAQYASETLTDPFDNLAKFLLNYYNVPPDR